MPYLSQSFVSSLGMSQFARLLATTTQIGTHPETEDRLLIPITDRYSGTYILGVQGVGKSGLLLNLIAQDVIQEHAVIVIDPHGDLTEHCIARLPEERLDKTYLLNMEDVAFPFGVNLFANNQKNGSVAQAQAIDRVMHVFEVLWPDILDQHYLPRYLRAATITLFANPGSTLVDMYTLLTDARVRQRMLQAVSDLSVKQFWQTQYDELLATDRSQRVRPLIGRLEALFMGRTLVRNIVGQRVTTIDFRRAIEAKEIIFIKLPIKTLSQDARLIGTLLVAQIHAAIFSFAGLPEQKRPGFSLFVDEFQHFATSDFSEMFTEGRKFGVRVTLAHQYRRQIPDFLRASTLTARTIVCFQPTPEDSKEMSHLYLNGEATLKPEDIETRSVDFLLQYGSPDPQVQMFIDFYLRPLQAQIRNGFVEVINPGFRAEHIAYWLMNVEAPKDKPRVADPIPYLNHLLYEVMKTGQSTLEVNPNIVKGFANYGHGFFAAFRYARDKKRLLSADVSFPPALVVEMADGSFWTRQPEHGKEQLYHFLFHLRQTMKHLAHSPIGKKSNLSATDVAHMLLRLPRRAAFVRSGEVTGVVYTDDTIKGVSSAMLRHRLHLIRSQTRNKYCSKLDQSGANLPPGPVVKEPQLSRWEVVP